MMTSQHIPAIQSEDLQLKIENRMGRIESLRTLGNLLETTVQPDGVVEVSGPVPSRLIKKFVLQSLKEIPGIKNVKDGIVADPDLELTSARSFVEDNRTSDIPPGHIFVRSHLGVIRLTGRIPVGFHLQDVLDVTSNVPGVRDVNVRLRV